MSSHMRPPRMWVGHVRPQSQNARRFWIRALQPISRVFVSSITTTAFCNGKDTTGSRLIRHLRDSDSAAVAPVTYVTQRIFP